MDSLPNSPAKRRRTTQDSSAMNAIGAINSRLDCSMPSEPAIRCAPNARTSSALHVAGTAKLISTGNALLETTARQAAKQETRRVQERLRAHGPPKHRLYHRRYPNEHSLRMPDLVKRIFAPPNCLYPAVDSPGRDMHSRRNTHERTRAGNATVTVAQERMLDSAVRKTLPQTTHARRTWQVADRPAVARQALPWMSVDSLGNVPQRPKSPRTRLERWSGYRDWAARGPPEAAQMGSTQSSSGTLESCSSLRSSVASKLDLGQSLSLYSAIPSSCCLSLPEDCERKCEHLCKPSMTLNQRLQSVSMEELLDQDIQSFLQGRWRPDPVTEWSV